MSIEWKEAATNNHQDHVIAHVVGATALGYFVADEAFHLVLDIGFIWTLLLDGEMSLLPESMALSELNVKAETRDALNAGVSTLHDAEQRSAVLPAPLMPAPEGLLIEEVGIYHDSGGGRRRIVISGERACLSVEASAETRGFEPTAST